MSYYPRPCPNCLRRARLLAQLAPYIERSALEVRGDRLPELLRLDNYELAAAVAPDAAPELLDRVTAASDEQLETELAESGCWCCCQHDPRFPVGLREAPGAPWALFGRGDATLIEKLQPEAAVTIVGARRASTYGREVARELGRDLADAGLLVISGLSFGVDACAHRGALDGGKTVAVLGCGVDVAYPAAHRSLWRRITDSGGLVLSELPPGCGTWRWTFSARSRITAALSAMTIVVEAAKNSGSLLTADIAAELGRDVGAVPGPIGSRVSVGPNDLLAGGACLVRDAQDVFDSMLGAGVRRIRPLGQPLNPTEYNVLRALEDGARDAEEIAADVGISEDEAEGNLAALRAHGYVERHTKSVYCPSGLEPPSQS